MGRPKGLRARVAVVVGELVSKRGGGTVAYLRVAVEPGEHVARRGTAQSHERREGDSGAEREQDDAGDAKARGANCHAPAHEAARNRMATASAKTSGGHTRSTRSARRAQTASAASRPPSIDGLSEFFTAMP